MGGQGVPKQIYTCLPTHIAPPAVLLEAGVVVVRAHPAPAPATPLPRAMLLPLRLPPRPRLLPALGRHVEKRRRLGRARDLEHGVPRRVRPHARLAEVVVAAPPAAVAVARDGRGAAAVAPDWVVVVGRWGEGVCRRICCSFVCVGGGGGKKNSTQHTLYTSRTSMI